MKIAITGATGFLGRYITNRLLGAGHDCRCWYRQSSDRGGFTTGPATLTWLPGVLGDNAAVACLVAGVDAVVHAGVHRPPHGVGHRAADNDPTAFAQTNILGSLALIQAAHEAGVARFIFISSCGVHDVIRDDRPLDEAHPRWPLTHYGASKAAVEMFVHSFGLPHRVDRSAAPTHRHLSDKSAWPICALRPVGIYGLRRPPSSGKWHGIVKRVLLGEPIEDASGGKEVHAHDVAGAVEVLLATDASRIAGQCFNCCDGYISAEQVARIAAQAAGSSSRITTVNRGPRHQIRSDKLTRLGVTFGGEPRVHTYVQELIASIRQ